MREGFFCERSEPRAQTPPTPSTKTVRADTSEPTRQNRAVRTSRPDTPDPMKAVKRRGRKPDTETPTQNARSKIKGLSQQPKKGKGFAVRDSRHTRNAKPIRAERAKAKAP